MFIRLTTATNQLVLQRVGSVYTQWWFFVAGCDGNESKPNDKATKCDEFGSLFGCHIQYA